ncbi:MAG: HupE/UreJ family protein, partial [Candidatus Competibacteraceae bacterium]|nr:HupE/UreJ family protein [Candidatus Competibacteraceae bacterium]
LDGLLALLLPAVLWRENGRWRPAAALRTVLLETVAIVTAFTVAHSLTLTLAVLGVVNLPSRWVETMIAFTIVLAALNNLFPLVTTRRWSLAFGLGLIHGFGFASALRDLGLPSDALALALAGFNLGVETGQLAIVALMLPLAYALRQTWLYQRLTLPVGSATVALLALVWCLERGLNLALLSMPG